MFVRTEKIEHSIELIEVLAREGRKMRLIFWQGQGLEEDIELLPGATAPGSDELASGSDELALVLTSCPLVPTNWPQRVAINTIRGTGRKRRLNFWPGQEPE